MNYASELKKFVTSQYIYSGVRIALAIVVPSIILAYFGLLKEYFLFPLGTSFVGLTDMPGPFIRRRNSLTIAAICFCFVAIIATLVKGIPILVYSEIILFGIFFTMISVYGLRMAAVGGLTLVVLSIFIDGHLTGTDLLHNILTFAAGCFWFILVFLVVTTLQPYKLASQMIGENYLELANFLRLKAGFYQKDPDYNQLLTQVISQQVKIKNLQEETRETVFRTRKIVSESTTTSRLLMLMFLNSMDLHEKLMTSENDYRRIQQSFGESKILTAINDFLLKLATELESIGIAMQSNSKAVAQYNISHELNEVYQVYFDYRATHLGSDTLEEFLVLRQILKRISEIADEINSIFIIDSQNPKLAKSLSTNLDFEKFLPNEEKLSFKVLRNNLSLKSGLFRHAIRLTLALLLGYSVSRIEAFSIGHSYWILITIIAIMRPSYSITKSRNILRLYGTIVGGILAYGILYFIENDFALLGILLTSMILCFSFLKDRYFWAILFMTIYVLLAFNILNPGNLNEIFVDRIIDTLIAGIICSSVAYFVLPVWENAQTLVHMKKSVVSATQYVENVINQLLENSVSLEKYKLSRKHALINLANLSDNFQRMISDPKNQQKKLESVHQFVSTSHLLLAYTASLSQYTLNERKYKEIDFEAWKTKILSELTRTDNLLNNRESQEELRRVRKLQPNDKVEELLEKRKLEIDDNLVYDHRDTQKITRLTELKNIREILELMYDVAREQRKVVEHYYKDVEPNVN